MNNTTMELPVRATPLDEVFKALGDPLRLDIVRRMAIGGEVACTALEQDLQVAKSTISYHVKVLYHAGLVEIRKEGRFYFYSLPADALVNELPGLRELISAYEPHTPA